MGRIKGGSANLTDKQKAEFLGHYSQVGTITHAAELTGITRQTVYDWKMSDPAFVRAIEDAAIAAAERLEQEARRRAVEGTLEPVFYRGSEVGYVRRYSDNLLTTLLKGAMPEKYKDRVAAEVTGANGGPVQTVDLSRLSDEELEKLNGLVAKANPDPPAD